MKKNLATVIILLFTLLNLALSCVILFTMVPSNQKVNELITKIAASIDLDLADDTANEYVQQATNEVAMSDTETYNIEDDITANLTPGEDGSTSHMAVVSAGIVQNTTSEAYATYGGADNMSANETRIRSTILSVLGGFTYEELRSDPSAATKACADALNALFGSEDFIVEVVFSQAVYQ